MLKLIDSRTHIINCIYKNIKMMAIKNDRLRQRYKAVIYQRTMKSLGLKSTGSIDDDLRILRQRFTKESDFHAYV